MGDLVQSSSKRDRDLHKVIEDQLLERVMNKFQVHHLLHSSLALSLSFSCVLTRMRFVSTCSRWSVRKSEPPPPLLLWVHASVRRA